MDVRQEIRDAPRVLKETLEKGRPEFEALIRRTRWGEGPVYIIGSGVSYHAALAGRLGFEELLGWPVVARRSAEFAAYSASLIRPRSVLLAISPSGESEETVAAARQARARGAVVLALSQNTASPLAEAADGVFQIRAGEASAGSILSGLCLHAAAGYISVVAAQVLKRHHQKLDSLENEFHKLPEQAEWVLTQLSGAARSLAGEIKGLSRLAMVGGGFYYASALQAAAEMDRRAALHAEACEVSDGVDRGAFAKETQSAILFLSGSRCRLKKEIHAAAQRAKVAGLRAFAVTDANDRELSERAELAVLLPPVGEATGSTLALLFLQWLACQAGGGRPKSGRTSRAGHRLGSTQA